MLKCLIKDEFVSPDDKIAVGVSGGADSMVLLSAMLEKQKEVKFFLEVIHVNHHLRGGESDGDSLFVEKFCQKKKIPYKIVDVDVLKLKNDKKMTLEESARVARFSAIFDEMKAKGLNKLFLAHHKNDQVETILMHIFRGSGLSGAVGLKNSNMVFRPLVNLRKEEILKIAEENKIKFVTDSSNSDNNFSRNYIRNVVLPAVEKHYPGVVENIFQFGEKCREIDQFIKQQVNRNLIQKIDKEIVLKGEALENKSFIVYEYLKIIFEELGVFSDIESKHYLMIYNLKDLPVNSEINLPHKLIAKKTYAGIKFFKQRKIEKNAINQQFVIGLASYGDFEINTEFVSNEQVEYGEGSLYIDYLKLPHNAVWRLRQLGDKFSKLGTGSKKLNDYFTDKKIDVDLRDKIPVLASGNEVLVVLGYDISDKVKVDYSTEKIVKINTIKV